RPIAAGPRGGRARPSSVPSAPGRPSTIVPSAAGRPSMWSTRLLRPRRASRAGASLTRHGERGGPHSPAAFHAVSVRAIPQIMQNSILVRSATAAAALALALTACGGQQEQSPSAGSDEGGAVEASEPAEDATDSEGQETDTDDGEFGSDDESTTDDEASGDS